MTFAVLIYAMGGYAVVLLAGMLMLEHTREPVRQRHPSSTTSTIRPSLRPWPRAARGCPVGHERTLPLRTAQLAAPPRRRRRPAQTSCRH